MPTVLTKLVQGSLIGLLLSMLAEMLGLDLSTVQVAAGSIGLGVGFSLQVVIADFLAGFVLLLDRSIRTGDVISFSGTQGISGSGFGWVQEFRARHVVISNRDGIQILMPFHYLIGNSIINWSYSERRVRLKVPIHIGFENDPDRALSLLVQCALQHSRVLKEPPPVGFLKTFAESAMQLELQIWIADPENGVNNVIADLNLVIQKQFKNADISVPVKRLEWHAR